MKSLLFILIIAAVSFKAECALAVDISGKFSNYTCLKASGRDLAIIRAYHSYGAIDTDAPLNIKQSNAAGLLTDVYLFPCRGKNATTQANQMIDYLDSVSANATSPYEYIYGTIWLDIETNPSTGCSWSLKSAAENCDFVQELVSAIKKRGRAVGIYASAYMWTQILGAKDACQKFVDIPLWYPHYDSQASFADWESSKFGGWSTPTIKQYNGDSVVCGFTMDVDYF